MSMGHTMREESGSCDKGKLDGTKDTSARIRGHAQNPPSPLPRLYKSR